MSEDDQNLIVLAVRAGFQPGVAAGMVGKSEGDLASALAEDQDFNAQYERALEDAVKTAVIAANVKREHARVDPAAAKAYLVEWQAEQDLELVRQLTAGK